MSEAISITGEKRWDSEYYIKYYIKTNNLLNNKNTVPFSSFCNYIKKGIFDLSPDNYKKSGIPFIRTSEIKYPLIDFTTTTFLDEETHFNNFKTKLKAHDLVFTKIGAYIGDVAILPQLFSEYNFSQNVAGASIKEKTDSPYLLTFFLSDIGKSQILRSSMLSGQGKLELEDIRNFKIVTATKIFKERISHLINDIEVIDYKSGQLYSKAEDSLLIELGFENWVQNTDNVSVKTLKDSFCSSGRLDAEYYQPKFGELLDRLSNLEHDRIAEIVNLNKSIEPGSEAYQDSGIPFVRVADVTKFGISQPSIYLSPNDYDLEGLKPRKDTILLSKDGSVGIAYKVESDMDCITSGALLHLTVFNKDYLPDYLTLVLNSVVVQMQAERDAGGSIIQHWKPSEINNVVIPKLPMTKQIEISQMIQESFVLRHKSERLLDVAKKAVEIAISENEENALNYIAESNC